MKYSIDFNSETKFDYTITTAQKKLWAAELELLEEFQNLCEKYNLSYFASGGTLIGAARHQGFIPWDDDIDIHMFINDYNKICKIAPKELSAPFFWQDWKTEPGFTPKFSKLRNSNTFGDEKKEIDLWNGKTNLGVFIDIFPLFYIPDNKYKARFQLLLLRVIYAFIRIYIYKREGKYDNGNSRRMKLRRFLYPVICHIIPYNKLCNLYLSVCSMQKKPTERIGALSFDFNEPRFIWKTSYYREMIDLPFMGGTIKCPIEYDKCLQQQFGDWHKIVKNASMHSGLIYDVDTPYAIKLADRINKR